MYKHSMTPHYHYAPHYPTWRARPFPTVGSFGGLARTVGMVLAVLLMVAPEMLGSVPHYWIQRVSWLAIGMILWPLAYSSIHLVLRYGAVLGWLLVAAVLYTKGVGATLPVSLPSQGAIASAFETDRSYASSRPGIKHVSIEGSTRLLDWYNSANSGVSSGSYRGSGLSYGSNSSGGAPEAMGSGSVEIVGDISGWTYVNLAGSRPRVVRVRTRPSRTSVTRTQPVQMETPEIDYEALAKRYEVSMNHSGPQSWAAPRDNDSFYFGSALAQKDRNWYGFSDSSGMMGSSGGGIDALLGPVENVSNQIVDFTGLDGLTQHIDRIVSLSRRR
jgi:hypothetical protein